MRHALPLMLLLATAACSTTHQVSLPHASTAPIAPATAAARSTLAPVRVADNRRTGREDLLRVGTIRGGYGNPLKVLRADAPITEVVQRAFDAALAARGMLASPGGAEPRHLLAVTVVEFDANQYVRREATAQFGGTLTDRASGEVLWSDSVRVYQVDGSLLTLSSGILASTDDLRRLALRVMNQAVDEMLSKPGLAEALRQARTV
jgi:hypothetical protein